MVQDKKACVSAVEHEIDCLKDKEYFISSPVADGAYLGISF